MRRIAMLVVVPLVCGVEAQAQTNACCQADPAASRSDSARLARAIVSQSPIRVRLRGSAAVLFGPLVVSGPSIAFDSARTILGDELSSPVDLPLVLGVDIRRRPYWGLIIGGGLAGAVAAVRIGRFYSTSCILDCTADRSEYSSGEVLGYAVAGAAAGALIGVTIDSLMSQWVAVYARTPGAG